ncbi:MAG: ATP-dependent Clp protease adaptor ClpS [bacterium]
MSETLAAPVITTRTKTMAALAPLYHVILLNDDDHTFGYVIEMLCKIFGHEPATGHQMAWEVHRTGRVIVVTTHKELAELRQEQIHDYGADPLAPNCKGSMSALVEQAA